MGGFGIDWYITGQRHDRVQTESQIATVDSCFDLVGSLQRGVASCEVFSWSTDIQFHLRSSPSAYSGFVKRPNKVETAVHGCNLAFSLDSIVSLPR